MEEGLPIAFVRHRSPGRLRLHIPSRKRDAPFFQERITPPFSQLSGVERIETNPLTGSILLLHHLDIDSLAQFARDKGLFALQLKKEAASFHQAAIRAFSTLEGRTSELTGGAVNLGALASIALIAAGTYQILKGNVSAIPWYTAFWYGLNLFLKSKPEGGASEGE
ncbi:MAG: hypothetical protein N3G78_00745 [Desulfobacterota bacterium]|nr:hypothetical protein [Thermodesulfobacteriota bacterium]